MSYVTGIDYASPSWAQDFPLSPGERPLSESTEDRSAVRPPEATRLGARIATRVKPTELVDQQALGGLEPTYESVQHAQALTLLHPREPPGSF
jgi:hypothetical protein